MVIRLIRALKMVDYTIGIFSTVESGPHSCPNGSNLESNQYYTKFAPDTKIHCYKPHNSNFNVKKGGASYFSVTLYTVEND